MTVYSVHRGCVIAVVEPQNQKWSTSQRPAGLTARERRAESTLPTKSPSTRLERLPSSLRESVVMTENNPVMVVRPSPSSTRRQRPRRSDASTSSWVVTRRPRVPHSLSDLSVLVLLFSTTLLLIPLHMPCSLMH
ncbi:hypothetical protein PNOK_0309300 [Pyrrhoderma noxium]|uniref:Uncharacterized protein n=1 Tax=Pyrrhoderma noxium TaxID=2282107 RepID=A0A286ULG1_9AGAM|nr:hypothetical protein PNOK_0309300 [Pyrrhoderma noxium]